jgi:hypothetical protein
MVALAVGVALLFAAQRDALAQTVPEIPSYPIGYFGGYTGDVAVDDGLAVVAVASGLRVLDLSADWPRTLGPALPIGGLANWVAVDGRRAYAVRLDDTLIVADLSNPAVPRRRGSLALAGGALGIAAEGSLVLVALGSAGLDLIDVSDPDTPRRIRTMLSSPQSGAYSVAVAAGYAYAGHRNALTMLDVSDPLAPRVRARVEVGLGTVTALAIREPLLALALGDNDRVMVLDALQMQIRGSVAVTGYVRRLAFVDGYLLAAGTWHDLNAGGALWQLDVTNPSALTLRAGPEPQGARAKVPSSSPGLAAWRGRVYLTDLRAGLLALDLSEAGGPLRPVGVSGIGLPTDLAISGRHALTVDPYIGLTALDLEAPGGPAVVMADGGAVAADSVTIAGRRAYAWQSQTWPQLAPPSVSIYDLSQGLPATAASRLGGQPDGLTGWGEMLYLARSGTLVTYDVSDARSPQLTTQRTIHRGRAWMVAQDGWLFTLFESTMLLRSYSLVIPQRPSLQAELQLGQSGDLGRIDWFAAVGERLYAHGQFGHLAVIDIASPAAPRELSPAPLEQRPIAAATDGRLWVLNFQGQAYRVDVSQAGQVRFDGRLLLADAVRYTDLVPVGDRLVLNGGTNGLTIVRLGAPPTATPAPTVPPSPTATRGATARPPTPAPTSPTPPASLWIPIALGKSALPGRLEAQVGHRQDERPRLEGELADETEAADGPERSDGGQQR